MGLEPNEKSKRTEHGQNGVVNGREEHEEALVALVEHRTREVKNLRYYISYYTIQLEEAERRLQESKSKLALLRGQTSARSSEVETKHVKTDHGSKNALSHKSEPSSKNHHQSNPHLLVPVVSSKISQSIPLPPSPPHTSVTKSSAVGLMIGSTVKSAKSHGVYNEQEDIEIKERGNKRKFGQEEHEELIALICKSSSPRSVDYQMSSHFSSQHKRRVRCIALCPVNDQRFATSALDGVVNLWEVHSSGSGVSLLRTTDCISPKQRRWPEDIAWHPGGNRLFSVHSADGQDSQISVTDLSGVQGGGRAHVNFLEDKPHVKGVINSIVFLPWENTSFVTGGTDHAVIMWNENGENKWKPTLLHRNSHSSAVMGVAGMHQKQIVLSAGKDKRILGYDVDVGIPDFVHQVDSKCLSVLPNPCDFNLFMVQTGTHERQLRLFDIRSKGIELHVFGWKQESSDSQSALINQAWSPSGLYITSGSADPTIHIFDIRYNGHKPSQSIEAHQKRVFRAMWLHSVPFLVSISSDLNIGLHKVV
ncbi:Guanine nucleotide-binding protein subunit beta protein [Spatholobus suberectus]|nr:Guanine nucleotide-binding protein subunit beta protein [Spatholobus suberectus]